MSNPITSQHVSPSGTVLPETRHFPRPEGQSTPLKRSYQTPINQALALLACDQDDCRDLSALPPRYYGEDCDHQEFFAPESLLQLAESDPDWGLLDEPGPRQAQTVEAISATINELHRCFDHSKPMSGRLRLRLMAACRQELALLLSEQGWEGGGAAR